MYKTLIIDDEVVIRDGLKYIIDWKNYGFTICDEGINGKDGLEKVKELEPDLVIVDLRMPGLTGLEMIEQLRKEGYKTRFIILTGYDEFEYAKKAIQHSVDAYLLKPIEETELIESLSVVKSKLDQDKHDNFYAETVDMALENVLRQMVLQETDEKRIMNYNEIYYLNLPWDTYQLILIENKEKKYDSKLYDTIEEFIDIRCKGYVFDINNYICLILKDYYLTVNNKSTLKYLYSEIKEKSDIEVTIAVGEPVDQLSKLNESYKKVIKLFEKKFIYSNNIIIFKANNGESKGDSEEKEIDIEYIVNKLYIAIDVYEIDYIGDLLNNLKKRLIDCEMDESSIKAIYVNIYTMIYNKLMMNYESFISQVNSERDIINDIYKKKNMENLHLYIKNFVHEICEIISVNNPESVLKRVVYYIDNNYREDITLGKISEVFGYNSTYLGKRFKKYTGVKFNRYLDNVRINHAKQLLKEGNKVQDVAKEVGYCDKDYFYVKFKKYVGISPSEYKNK